VVQAKHQNMILSDTRILEEIEKGTIKIVPYDRANLGSNSYDVRLGKTLLRMSMRNWMRKTQSYQTF
jgi:deoxycytidine triphosphate deaminase